MVFIHMASSLIVCQNHKVSNSEKAKTKITTKNMLSDYKNISNIQTFSAKNGDGVDNAF